ncbi:MAG: ATP-dependent RecD-like DNA helicase [Syntrophales bacterium]|jgi:exodeoxyribonuclease V alpha subunit|nr:ATP-dependent RecD-like DNA helicase [Syntrophales bacterium]MCK9527278.1 ATP-dependent RecD-like DNA helicase [Syntrophales bacterium]MDX9921252.1 ATP-dependent RecD-like DNA helicase [Syntrophales bacterium]
MAELQGHIENIPYFDEESGFAIVRLRVRGSRDLVTCVGSMAAPIPGEMLSMEGEWINHPRYGRQFKADSCLTTAPASVQGIRKYLGSGLIKGIGPVMSRRIVGTFGADTLDIIDNDIGRLMEIPGIGEQRVGSIEKAWREQKEIRSVMIFLQGHGVSTAYAARIFKHYGKDSIRLVGENPYRLAMDIAGIGFLTADKIAGNMGFARDSHRRAEAGILYVLNQLADQGHVYYPERLLVDEACSMLDVESTLVETALGVLAEEKRIIRDTRTDSDQSAVYLPPFYQAETQAAERMKVLVGTARDSLGIDAGAAIAHAQKTMAVTLAPKQVEALQSSIKNKVLIITGGPGTGKTTILKAILNIHTGRTARVLLAAPTGRAAKKLSEATGREAKTIHRLLEFNGRRGGFQKTEDSPLECDMLVVDETSMIDIVLLYHLLKALPARATLILVGDVNQLPSVGPGMVLRDTIDSGVIPVVELNEIFRQARESSIIVNAHKINQGLSPDTEPQQEGLSDFYFIEQEEPEKVLDTLIRLVKERIPARFGLHPLYDIQVLTPMNRGTLGVSNLNNELQKVLNPGEHGVTRSGREFRINDKVMQITNNYDKEVFNGDIGRIVALGRDEQEIRVLFDDRLITYDYAELDELVPAYAVTVHKSQGSEYPAVVIPVLTQHYMMLQRNLLYTAVTRGRKLVVLIGTKKALAIAVKNNRTRQRFSLLKERLRGPGVPPHHSENL